MRLAAWQECTGEAHDNAYIDHCYTCMPYWGSFPVCPDDGARLRIPNKLERKQGRCPVCNGRYSLIVPTRSFAA